MTDGRSIYIFERYIFEVVQTYMIVHGFTVQHGGTNKHTWLSLYRVGGKVARNVTRFLLPALQPSADLNSRTADPKKRKKADPVSRTARAVAEETVTPGGREQLVCWFGFEFREGWQVAPSVFLGQQVKKQYATLWWTAKLAIGRKVPGSTLYIPLTVLACK